MPSPKGFSIVLEHLLTLIITNLSFVSNLHHHDHHQPHEHCLIEQKRPAAAAAGEVNHAGIWREGLCIGPSGPFER